MDKTFNNASLKALSKAATGPLPIAVFSISISFILSLIEAVH